MSDVYQCSRCKPMCLLVANDDDMPTIMKGKKVFKLPEELKMNDNSRQHDDQIKRLVSNGQIEVEII